MIELPREKGWKVEELFAYTEETLVLSFTQDCMGRGWVNRMENPTCAKLAVGDFAFLAGDYTSPEAGALVTHIPDNQARDYILFIPENPQWGRLIEESFPKKYNKFQRYAIKKERDCFNRLYLEEIVKDLPPEYELKQIDEDLYKRTKIRGFTADFCSQFLTAREYVRRGLGFCILHRGEIVAGASSYTVYRDGIEIEIGTREDYRRKGLALVCAARLILACLDRGWYPSWDAANLMSVKLAEKLGYHFSHAYDTYFVHIENEQ